MQHWPIIVATLCWSILACGDDEHPGTTDSAETTDAADTSQADSAPDGDAAAADTAADADAAADADTAADAAETDTSEPGTVRVGFRQEEISYESPDGSGPRSLRVVAWYPTEAESGEEVQYLPILPVAGVLGDAPPVAGTLPVVVFSHGNSAFAEQSFFFTEDLARNGYLVVALDHTGNTFGMTADVAIYHWRPQDISAVIDHLVALPAGHPLAGLVGDDIALAGHSFGGYTTLAAGGAGWDVDAVIAYCESGEIPLGGCKAIVDREEMYRAGFLDARIDALIPMAPGATVVFGLEGARAIALPTLLVTAALDATTTNANDGDPMWEQLGGGPDNRRIDLATGGHFTFSDVCSFGIGIGLGDGCGEGFLSAERAHAAVNAYALAFLDLHLRGDASGLPLLDGAVTIEDDVTLSLPDR